MIWLNESDATIGMLISYFVVLIFVQILLFISQIFAYSTNNRMFGGKMHFEFIFNKTKKKHILILLKVIVISALIGIFSFFIFIEMAILMGFIIFYTSAYITIFFAYVVTIKSKEDPNNLEVKRINKKHISDGKLIDKTTFVNMGYNINFKTYVGISILIVFMGCFLIIMSTNDGEKSLFSVISTIGLVAMGLLFIWFGFFITNYSVLSISNNDLLLQNKFNSKTISIENIKQIKFHGNNLIIENKNTSKRIKFRFQFTEEKDISLSSKYDDISNALGMNVYETNKDDLVIIK